MLIKIQQVFHVRKQTIVCADDVAVFVVLNPARTGFGYIQPATSVVVKAPLAEHHPAVAVLPDTIPVTRN